MSARPSAERCWWSPRLPPATRPPLTGLKLPLRGGNYGCLVTTHDPPIITASVRAAGSELRRSKRSVSRHEDAEGVAVTIGVDAQRFFGIV
jgi:hypothetical protein